MSIDVDHTPCVAYNRNGPLCANGFPQKPICRGYGGCVSCGNHSERSTPWCQFEEFPRHMSWLLTDSGLPKALSAHPTPSKDTK